MDLFPRGNAHTHWAKWTQPCGATRLPLGDAGWECTGKGLIVVTTTKIGGEVLPVVLPRRALEIIDSEPWWDQPVKDFAGGDHLHLKVSRRPTDFQGDTPVVRGDQVVPFKFIGTTTDGGQLYIGEPT